MSKTRMRAGLPLLSLCLLAAPAAAQLLYETGPSGTVDVDLDLLRGAPTRLELATPEGLVAEAVRTYFEGGGSEGVLWRGRIGEALFDGVVLTEVDGVLLGRFTDQTGSYRIDHGADGLHRVFAADPPLRPWCGTDEVGRERTFAIDALADRQATASPVIDVLAVYTAAAATNRGGAAEMEAAIRHSANYLNTALRNSRVEASVRIAKIAPAPAGVPSASSEDDDPLDWMARNETLRRWRRESGADLVHLFVADDTAPYCGIAEVLAKGDTAAKFRPLAVAVTVVGLDCEDYDVTFAHEVGHNLGGLHDPESSDPYPDEYAIQPYAHGYTNEAARLHTLMSYGSFEAETFAVPYFSNVDVTRNGDAVGERDKSEVARAIRGTVGLIGGLLDSATPEPGSAPRAPANLTGIATGRDSVRLTWTDNSDDETSFEIVRSDGLGRIVEPTVKTVTATVAANVTEAELRGLSGLSESGYNTFTVRGRNDHGRSASSNEVSFHLAANGCASTSTAACMHGGRFQVTLDYSTAEVTNEAAQVKDVDLGPASALFYFFDDTNVEALVKVLDGCGVNGNFWVFGAAATDLPYRLIVVDTQTRRATGYLNPPGAPPAITDSKALDSCTR